MELIERAVRLAAYEAMVKDIPAQNNVKQQMRDAYTKQLEAAFQVSLSKLMNSAGVPETDNELWARVKYSIDTLGKLVDRGLEVHPDLMGPKEQQELFPSPKRLLEASQKLLASEVLPPTEEPAGN